MSEQLDATCMRCQRKFSGDPDAVVAWWKQHNAEPCSPQKRTKWQAIRGPLGFVMVGLGVAQIALGVTGPEGDWLTAVLGMFALVGGMRFIADDLLHEMRRGR